MSILRKSRVVSTVTGNRNPHHSDRKLRAYTRTNMDGDIGLGATTASLTLELSRTTQSDDAHKHCKVVQLQTQTGKNSLTLRVRIVPGKSSAAPSDSHDQVTRAESTSHRHLRCHHETTFDDLEALCRQRSESANLRPRCWPIPPLG